MKIVAVKRGLKACLIKIIIFSNARPSYFRTRITLLLTLSLFFIFERQSEQAAAYCVQSRLLIVVFSALYTLSKISACCHESVYCHESLCYHAEYLVQMSMQATIAILRITHIYTGNEIAYLISMPNKLLRSVQDREWCASSCFSWRCCCVVVLLTST